MAALETTIRTSASVKLDGGTTTSGSQIYYSTAFTGVKTGAEDDGLVAVMDLLEPCVAYSPVYCEVKDTSYIYST